MKHEEIYYTCDRCGKELKYILNKYGLWYAAEFTEKQIEDAYETSPGRFECSVGTITKHYDLCPECRKELKKFLAMKV